MFKPLSMYVGLRYTRSRKKNHFVSFISLSAMLGIGLGVMVLITVLSVMNGFDEEIHKRFFGMAPEITINEQTGRMPHWRRLMKKIQATPGVRAVAPFVGSQGLLTFEGQVSPVMITGILPEEEEAITHLQNRLLLGNLSSMNHFGMIIGRGLAESLGLMLGDQVTVMIPEASVTPAGMLPRFKRFMIQGIFSAGAGFGFENKLVFIGLNDAQKLMRMDDNITGFKLKITHIYDAPRLSDQLSTYLGEHYQVSNWTEQFGAFFQAVKMEKTMMFLILVLIIAVAAFSLVSSLVMVVSDKQAEIAIMRTLGATPGFILRIFIVQGMMIGGVGTLLGLISGVLLASHATAFVAYLQSTFHLDLLTSNVYWVDFLPSKIMWIDLIHVCMVAFSMSFVATLYPAWRASRTIIAQALHYE